MQNIAIMQCIVQIFVENFAFPFQKILLLDGALAKYVFLNSFLTKHNLRWESILQAHSGLITFTVKQ